MPRSVALFLPLDAALSIFAMGLTNPQPLRGQQRARLKPFVALIAFASCTFLSGCSHMPHGRDIKMLHLVYRGQATHKQAFLWFKRTSYEALVSEGSYFVTWRQEGLYEARKVREEQSLGETIAKVAPSRKTRPGFYFLVRGIGRDETIFCGDIAEGQPDTPHVIPGDLLIINPPPDHELFRKVHVSPPGEAESPR